MPFDLEVRILQHSRGDNVQHIKLGAADRIRRAAWAFAWIFGFRWTPRPFHFWRIFLLKCFGARIGRGCRVYQSAKVWAPWNLEMADASCLGDYVDCYNVATVVLARGAVVSQYSYLCTATRDFDKHDKALVALPIRLDVDSWVTADVFVGPGVTIGSRAVVLARSTVLSDIPADMVCGGYPARVIRRRVYGEGTAVNQ